MTDDEDDALYDEAEMMFGPKSPIEAEGLMGCPSYVGGIRCVGYRIAAPGPDGTRTVWGRPQNEGDPDYSVMTFWNSLAAGSECHTAEEKPRAGLDLRRKPDRGEDFDDLVEEVIARLEPDYEVWPHPSHTDRHRYDSVSIRTKPKRA